MSRTGQRKCTIFYFSIEWCVTIPYEARVLKRVLKNPNNYFLLFITFLIESNEDYIVIKIILKNIRKMEAINLKIICNWSSSMAQGFSLRILSKSIILLQIYHTSNFGQTIFSIDAHLIRQNTIDSTTTTIELLISFNNTRSSELYPKNRSPRITTVNCYLSRTWILHGSICWSKFLAQAKTQNTFIHFSIRTILESFISV